MKLQDVVEQMSLGDSVDVKELILAVTENENLKSIYESIKDTSN